MDIKKILWPTDFSENAAQALALVTSLAEKYQAEIHILYVLKDYPAFGASYGQYDPNDYQKMKDWEKQFAESRLDEICEKFLNACPLYIRHISVGEPAKEILKMRDSTKNQGLLMMNPFMGWNDYVDRNIASYIQENPDIFVFMIYLSILLWEFPVPFLIYNLSFFIYNLV
jgi:nucleotide-binding universal stress UspA family protein